MKAKTKVKIKDVPSEKKTSAQIAEELEAEGKRLLEVARILRDGPRQGVVTYPKMKKRVKNGGRDW